MTRGHGSNDQELILPAGASKGGAGVPVSLIRGRDALESLRSAWEELERAGDVPVFQRFAWAKAWLEHWQNEGEPWLLVAGDPVRGILPLFRRTGQFRKQLTLVGHGVSDYLGPLADSPEVAEALGAALGSLSRRVHSTVLLGLTAGDADAEAFLAAVGRPMVSRTYEQCPAISTKEGWDSYLTARPKKFRANLKHTARGIAKLGEVTVSVEDASERLFEEMLDVEQGSWKWAGGFAFLKDPTQKAFFRDIVLSAEIPQQMWTCRVDGRLTAFALVFTLGDRWHYYWPSFRDEARGAGMYLMAAIVEGCCDAGMEEFDFLGGDEAYKMRWQTRINHTLEVVVRGRAPIGFLVSLAYGTRWWLARSERLREVRRRLLVKLKAGSAGS